MPQFQRGALQAAEKPRIQIKRAKIVGPKTINQGSRIAPAAFWRDLFFAPFEKSSFSAACKAHAHFGWSMYGLKPVPFKLTHYLLTHWLAG
jgi:hypothetical protein